MDKIQQAIEQFPPVAKVLQWSKMRSMPGFFKVPVYDVALFVWHETQRVTLISRANSTAFSFFLSLFPAIIFLFTVATLLPIYESFETEINGYIDHIMPTNAGEEVKILIKNLVKPNTRVLSIGFILTLYFSSNGMLALMEGFEKAHHKTFKQRSWYRKRLVAIALTMLMGGLLASSVVLIILGNFLINLLADLFNLTQAGAILIGFFRWLTIILLFYAGIAIIYRYGASLRRRFRWITPGATLATILSLISSLAFSFYVEAFDTYNKVYGSIGTIMVLMLWIQINCFILLVGFE
ncbi:MAG: YihY/virulence factor BrkB family protein, partial [Bacteroidota bacterium]